MSTIPNPWFTSSAEVVMPSVDTAAASPVIAPGPVDAAANQSDVEEMWAFIDDHRFVLDVEKFMDAIEPLPLFLQAPIDVINMLATF